MDSDYSLILSQYRRVCEAAAGRWQVSPEIHPKDFIFRFLYENPSFRSKEDAIRYYFDDGASSAQKLGSILKEVCGVCETNLDLLEFASGYGCVTRHLKQGVPFCSSLACDIHQDAVSFIQGQLKGEAVLSAAQPEALNLGKQFDAVFALSFFSHMPKSSFSRWMAKLVSVLKPEGCLLMTTHGQLSRRFISNCKFDDEGYCFFPSSEQGDLDRDSYGTSVTLPKYVFRQALDGLDLTLVEYRAGFWWAHQDLYVFKRPAEG